MVRLYGTFFSPACGPHGREGKRDAGRAGPRRYGPQLERRHGAREGRTRAIRPWSMPLFRPLRPFEGRWPTEGATSVDEALTRAADAAPQGMKATIPRVAGKGPRQLSGRAKRRSPGSRCDLLATSRCCPRPKRWQISCLMMAEFPDDTDGWQDSLLTMEERRMATVLSSHRPGHYEHPLHDLRSCGNVIGIDQKEHEQIYPEARLGRARCQRNLATHPGSDRRMPHARAASTRRRHRRGRASPTSARPPWSGTGDTGKPVYNAIVWQDTRTDAICNELAKDGGQDRFRDKSACRWRPISPARRSVDPGQRRGRARRGRDGRRRSSARSTPG